MYTSQVKWLWFGAKGTNFSKSLGRSMWELYTSAWLTPAYGYHINLVSYFYGKINSFVVTNLVLKRPNSLNHLVLVIIRLLIKSLVLFTSHKLAVTNLVSKRSNSVNHLVLVIIRHLKLGLLITVLVLHADFLKPKFNGLL